MRRDLERRLGKAEVQRFGSERVAAILRAWNTVSAGELKQMLAEPRGIFDPRTLTGAELDTLIGALDAHAVDSPDTEQP
jgi:hypothetical protein